MISLFTIFIIWMLAIAAFVIVYFLFGFLGRKSRYNREAAHRMANQLYLQQNKFLTLQFMLRTMMVNCSDEIKKQAEAMIEVIQYQPENEDQKVDNEYNN